MMKDILISAQRQKKEWWVFVLCLVAAFVVNVVAIIMYETSWAELITHLGYVVAIAVVLYVLTAILRGFISLIQLLVRGGRRKSQS